MGAVKHERYRILRHQALPIHMGAVINTSVTEYLGRHHVPNVPVSYISLFNPAPYLLFNIILPFLKSLVASIQE